MSSLGKGLGIFDLKESDRNVGSFLKKNDVKDILNLDNQILETIDFKNIDNLDVINELDLHKLWSKNLIQSPFMDKKITLDELIISRIVKNIFKNSNIEYQVKVDRFLMDLKIEIEGKPPIFIEFDGPSHFTITKWGSPKHDPFRKKYMVEDKTGIEVINWPYWVQRCESNVKSIYDRNIEGLGVIWSSNVHFGDFIFENSSEIICKMNDRFNMGDDEGYGYFYVNSKNRNNLEHPIIKKIKEGKENIDKLLPKGYIDREFWLPKILI